MVIATIAASHAAASPSQRRCHMPRRVNNTVCNKSFIRQSMLHATGHAAPRLEPTLRDDQDVTRTHVDVRGDVASPDEVTKTHAVEFPTFGRAEDARAVAIREVRQTADRDHDVE